MPPIPINVVRAAKNGPSSRACGIGNNIGTCWIPLDTSHMAVGFFGTRWPSIRYHESNNAMAVYRADRIPQEFTIHRVIGWDRCHEIPACSIVARGISNALQENIV
ncbi:hypothetical protein BGZ80_003078, partial [Entomortierella chlamydospora]